MPKPKPTPPGRFSLKKLKGRFSKWEVLLALVIVGVAAAILVPHFSNANSEDRREEASVTQLKNLRSFIETYKQQHKNTLPNLIMYDWKPLMQKTDSDGNISDSSDGFGPYLELPPINPFNQLSSIVDGDFSLTSTPADCGFIYDYNDAKGTGEIWPTDADKRTKLRL